MKSAWELEDKERIKKHQSLGESVEADVCIVGGGLAGLWSAYLLSKEGKKVVLIEKDELGRAATLYTTALVTQVIDTDLSDLARMFGDKKARLSWQAGAEAIEQIESVIREEEIDCDFKRVPIFTYASSDREMEILHAEAEEAKRLGFEAHIEHKQLSGFENTGAMEVPGQAKYHPMKFFGGLVEAAEKHGAKIYEKTEAIEITVRGRARVLTKSGYAVEADDAIVATHAPFNNPKPTHWKKGMYVTYVYALEFPKGPLAEGLYEDLHNPYHYFRIDDPPVQAGEEGKQTMIVGGEDHRAELRFEEGKSFRALKQYIDETFPGLDYKVTHKWSGEILEPSDGLPLIGAYAPHQYVASAFSGNGMTYSAIGGRVLTDLIMGRRNQYEDLYDPQRKMGGKPLLYKFRDYAGEFFGGAVKNLFK